MSLSQFARLFPYLKRYRTRLLLGFLCVILSNMAGSAAPWLMKSAVDSLDQTLVPDRRATRYLTDDLRDTHNRSIVTNKKLLSKNQKDHISKNLFAYGLLIVLLALLSGLFLFLMRRIIIGVSRYIEYDLRNNLFAHLLGLSQSFYHQNKTGDLISRSMHDMHAVRMMIGPGIMYSANTLVRLVIILPLMIYISPNLTLFAFLIVPVVAVAVKVFGAMIHHRFEKIQETFSDLSSNVQENLAGVRVIRAFTQEGTQTEKFRLLNQTYLQKNVDLIRVWGMFHPILAVLLSMGSVFVLWFGGRELITGNISPGDFVAFNTYLTLLTWPMIALGWVINIVQRGSASLKRVDYIFRAQTEIFDNSVAVQAFPSNHPFQGKQSSSVLAVQDETESNQAPASLFEGRIDIKNLSFSYNGALVLRNINLTIPAGSTYAIVGETGSGKSTLVQLLARVFDPSQGQVLIDGKVIQEYSLKTLRSQIGYVPQETFLFSETIRENITFGREKVEKAEIVSAAVLSHILPDIQGFPLGFQTMVGERGITLSGGQKQRTAIARALIRNPRILILDDALSSVDTLTEEEILKGLRAVMEGRTSILISHRVSTVKFSDQIIVLKKGTIVEQGTHQELVESDGYYADLHRKQMLEDELVEE